jgi:dTDP-4-dehydrorhamnose reductase
MLGRAVVREARRRGIPALGLAREQADVRDAERLLAWAKDFQPTAIVNCAAFTQVDACQERRDHAFAVNGAAVDHVVAAAAMVGAGLLQVSTDYVFPGRPAGEALPYREGDPPAPLSVYGESKLLGERRAAAYDRALVVRTSWLFGPGGPNFVATIARLLGEGRLPLRVVDDQHGCPTYAPFLARALVELAPLVAAGALTGHLHYCNREPTTWFGLAREIARQMAPAAEVLAVTTAQFPRPAPRPGYSVLATARFEAVTGRPVEPWCWGLSDYLQTLTTETRSGRS